MNIDPLLDVIINIILFFELSGSDAVQADVAVAMLEQIASALQRLDPDLRDRLINYAMSEARHATSEEQRLALQSLPENMGLSPT